MRASVTAAFNGSGGGLGKVSCEGTFRQDSQSHRIDDP